MNPLQQRLIGGAAVVALAAGLTACGDSTHGANKANAVTVTARDYSYGISGTLQAGVGTVTFRNTGKELHMMAITKLKPGVNVAQLVDALKSGDQSKAEPLVAGDPNSSLGTPQLLSPGASTTVATKDLSVGNYALLCFVPAKGGEPHFLKGMVNQLTVESAKSTVAAPKTDGTITLTEYKLGGDVQKLKKGKGTFEVVNNGKQPHDVTLIRLANGATITKVSSYYDKLFESGPQAGAAPGTIVAGVSGVDPGHTAWLTIDVPKGRYAVASVTGDTGKEDYRKGMFTYIDVK